MYFSKITAFAGLMSLVAATPMPMASNTPSKPIKQDGNTVQGPYKLIINSDDGKIKNQPIVLQKFNEQEDTAYFATVGSATTSIPDKFMMPSWEPFGMYTTPFGTGRQHYAALNFDTNDVKVNGFRDVTVSPLYLVDNRWQNTGEATANGKGFTYFLDKELLAAKVEEQSNVRVLVHDGQDHAFALCKVDGGREVVSVVHRGPTMMNVMAPEAEGTETEKVPSKPDTPTFPRGCRGISIQVKNYLIQ